MSYSPKNVNKLNLEERKEKNLKTADLNKITSYLRKKLLNNTPKEIKDVYKLLDDFEDESKINYSEDYEVKRRNFSTSVRKKKLHDRKEFPEESESKFDKYSKDDTNNSEGNNYAYFNNYNHNKSSNYEDDAISQINDSCFY